MRFLVDAQLPPALTRLLEPMGHEAQHVIELNFEAASDLTIWNYAKAHAATIVTKDEDFRALGMTDENGPPVIWIRIGNTTTPALLKTLSGSWQAITEALERGEPIIEVTEDR